MRVLFSALFICVIITSCSGDKPENLLEEDTYINMIVELQLLRSYQERLPDSTNFDSLQTIIYKKYGATEKQFRESHTFYQQDIEKQSERIKEGIERLRKNRLSPQDSTTAKKDSTITD